MIDIKELRAGDYISPNRIEDETGLAIESRGYQFYILKLCGELDRAGIHHKGENYGIRILSSSEANDYHYNMFNSYVGRMQRSRIRHSRIDLEELDHDERVTHRNRQCSMAAIEQATLSELKRQMRKLGPRTTKP